MIEHRQRNNRITIRLNDEEKRIFEEKRKLSNSKTMNHFILKSVIEKEIFNIDLEPFRELQWLLSNATNNINQIAKHINAYGAIYKNDINSIRNDLDIFSKEFWKIHDQLEQIINYINTKR